VPHIASFVQLNLGFPRARLGGMYLIGGIVSFVATRVAGRWVDRWGAARIGTAGAALVLVVIAAGFVADPPWLSVPVLFLTFFLANGLRNVPFNTLMTLVPLPHERAAFLSLQSATQHLAAALGAGLSSLLLTTSAGGALIGVPKVAAVAIAANVALLPLMVVLSRSTAAVPPSTPR
jgi:predicted MFS family arabinose efflux permease